MYPLVAALVWLGDAVHAPLYAHHLSVGGCHGFLLEEAILMRLLR